MSVCHNIKRFPDYTKSRTPSRAVDKGCLLRIAYLLDDLPFFSIAPPASAFGLTRCACRKVEGKSIQNTIGIHPYLCKRDRYLSYVLPAAKPGPNKAPRGKMRRQAEYFIEGMVRMLYRVRPAYRRLDPDIQRSIASLIWLASGGSREHSKTQTST